MKQYLLGIDVGTTGTKTMLFCTDGQLCGHAYRPYAMENPRWAIASRMRRIGGRQFARR